MTLRRPDHRGITGISVRCGVVWQLPGNPGSMGTIQESGRSKDAEGFDRADPDADPREKNVHSSHGNKFARSLWPQGEGEPIQDSASHLVYMSL